jgi:hypothetical protein
MASRSPSSSCPYSRRSRVFSTYQDERDKGMARGHVVRENWNRSKRRRLQKGGMRVVRRRRMPQKAGLAGHHAQRHVHVHVRTHACMCAAAAETLVCALRSVQPASRTPREGVTQLLACGRTYRGCERLQPLSAALQVRLAPDVGATTTSARASTATRGH